MSVAHALAIRKASGISIADVHTAEASNGRFRLLEPLGEGQHAIVYRAYDPILERDVATQSEPHRGVLKTVKCWTRLWPRPKHWRGCAIHGLCQSHEAGCAGGRHYIAMGLIEGSQPGRSARGVGPIAIRHAIEIVADLARGARLCPRPRSCAPSVKPANIRLDDRGAAYLMDFGIAYHSDSGEIPLPPGTILGTPAYVAPEQAEAAKRTICQPVISIAWALCSMSYSPASFRSAAPRLTCSSTQFITIHRPSQPLSRGFRVPSAQSARRLSPRIQNTATTIVRALLRTCGMAQWRKPPGVPPRLVKTTRLSLAAVVSRHQGNWLLASDRHQLVHFDLGLDLLFDVLLGHNLDRFVDRLAQLAIGWIAHRLRPDMKTPSPRRRNLPETPNPLAFVVALIGHVMKADVPLGPVTLAVFEAVFTANQEPPIMSRPSPLITPWRNVK